MCLFVHQAFVCFWTFPAAHLFDFSWTQVQTAQTCVSSKTKTKKMVNSLMIAGAHPRVHPIKVETEARAVLGSFLKQQLNSTSRGVTSLPESS